MAKAKKTVKLSRAAAKSLDLKHFGDEPVLTGAGQVELVNAYNWFNYICDSEDGKRFVLEYLEIEDYSKDFIASVKKVDPFELRTIGWTLRMAANGSKLDDSVVLKALEKLDKLVASLPAEVPVVESKRRDKIAPMIDFVISTIDQGYDILVTTGESKFAANSVFEGMNLGPAAMKQIVDHYTPLANELHVAIKGTDDQVKEAYSCFKKPMVRKMLEYVSGVVGSISEKIAEREAAKPKTRKPRRKKVKSPELLAKAAKFLSKSDVYGIESVAPAKIVGANQVWLFNVKDRKLTVVNSATASGLSIKGTTIINFDEKASKSKRVRKPEVVLKNLLEGGKVTVRKLMETINSVEYKATGRLNGDILIVKVVK